MSQEEQEQNEEPHQNLQYWSKLKILFWHIGGAYHFFFFNSKFLLNPKFFGPNIFLDPKFQYIRRSQTLFDPKNFGILSFLTVTILNPELFSNQKKSKF